MLPGWHDQMPVVSCLSFEVVLIKHCRQDNIIVGSFVCLSHLHMLALAVRNNANDVQNNLQGLTGGWA